MGSTVCSRESAQLLNEGSTVYFRVDCYKFPRRSTAKYFLNCYELLRLQGIRSTVTILFSYIFCSTVTIANCSRPLYSQQSRRCECQRNIQLQLSTAIVSRDRTLPMTEILNLVKECQSTVSHSRQSQSTVAGAENFVWVGMAHSAGGDSGARASAPPALLLIYGSRPGSSCGPALARQLL